MMETHKILKELNKLHKPIEKLSYEDYLLACINKYEKALVSMSKCVQSCSKCIYDVNSEQCARRNRCDDSICYRGTVDYFKKQAGLEVAE